MWHHFCKAEKAWISVGQGEPCNWCDAHEQKAASVARNTGGGAGMVMAPNGLNP